MRSKDYSNHKDSFTSLEPNEMVRLALVEGMKPKYGNDERQRYRRLVKEFLGMYDENIDKIFNLMAVANPTSAQKKFLNDLTEHAYYNSEFWNKFDYEKLRKEKVIIDYDGSTAGLVELVSNTKENKVIVAGQIADNKDYLKHIDYTNKLVLNGFDVVQRFAQEKGFTLPDSYLKYKKLNEKTYQLLEKYGFSFTEALKTGIMVLKDDKYDNREISCLAVKNQKGGELRLHNHDFIEAAELFAVMKKEKKEVIQVLGDLIWKHGDKYYGLNRFIVPKRIPFGKKKFNSVETHYLPALEKNQDKTKILEWMNTVVTCDCDHALNLRNFEERRGRKTYVTNTFDTHIGVVFLEIANKRKININESPNNMNPLPTPEFSTIVDKFRYNLAKTSIDDGKTTLKRADEVDIEILINELFKKPEWTFERAYQPKDKLSTYLLRKMY